MSRILSIKPSHRDLIAMAQWFTSKKAQPLLLGLAAGLAVICAIVIASTGRNEQPAAVAALTNPPAATADQIPAAQDVPEQVFKELSVQDAEAENAARPLSTRKLEVAPGFVLPSTGASQDSWNRAVNCLALANYYEAASEGVQGMRAVSQVVLNRVRHPSFPKSVCEVVFQGSTRSTGCQFTFTCDGSLNRPTVPALMERARAIAEQALKGRVEASVGMATHYHTRQVVPYWADTLDKIRTMGMHIFYVWRGAAGNRATFRGAYAGEPAEFSPGSAALAEAEALAGAAAGPSAEFQKEVNGLAAPSRALPGAKRAYLLADEGERALKADEHALKADDTAGRLQIQTGVPLLSEHGGLGK